MRLVRLLPLFFVMLSAVACTRLHAVPKELIGNWVTDDENYRGKTLAIDQEFIVLYLGEDVLPKAERIDRFTSTKDAGGMTYIFETRDRVGAHDKIKVSYRTAHGGELRLSNPSQVVWTRAPQAQVSQEK